MSLPVEVERLAVRFGDTRAVDDVSFSLPAGTITGLLGRNGAGKTTLLSVLAAFRRPTAGRVRVGGADPYENARLMSDICLIRSTGDFEESMTVGCILDIARDLRPRWDESFADRLVERFALPRRTKSRHLSQGMRSALAVTVGLATRAPLTLFDEPHLGMDAPSRYAFYDELLGDYLVNPRTVVLSTHLIDEVASLLEGIMIVDHGRLLTHQPADDLRAQGASITGPVAAVDATAAGLQILSERRLGATKSVVVYEGMDEHRRADAAAAGLEVGPIPLQDLFVQLTSEEATP